MSKAQRQRVREKEKKALAHAERISNFKIDADGFHILPLDDPDLITLQRSQEGFLSAKGYLKSLMGGQTMADAIPSQRTPWFANVDANSIVSDVRKLLSDDKLRDREEDWLRKVGPYYLRPFKDWYPKVLEVFRPVNVTADRDVLKAILAEIRTEYEVLIPQMDPKFVKDGKLKALNPTDTVPAIRTDSSSGYPFFTKKWFDEVSLDGDVTTPIEWGRIEAERILRDQDCSWETENVFILFTRKMFRGMADTPNLKSTERPVQCSGVLERFIGGGVQQCMVNLQKAHGYSCGLGGAKAVRQPITDAFQLHDSSFEADYSQFDATISGDIVSLIFSEVLAPIFHEDDQFRLATLAGHYAQARLWTPLGVIVPECAPGLMSGCMLTNVLGMIYGYMAWKYFTQTLNTRNGVELNAMALGYSDDLCVMFTKPETWESPSDIVSHFSEIVSELGLHAHRDKQGVFFCPGQKETSFLGCVWYEDRKGEDGLCLPVYPVARGLSKFIWHEYDKGDFWVDVDEYEKLPIDTSGMSAKQRDRVAMLARLSNMVNNQSFTPFLLYLRNSINLSSSDFQGLFKSPEKQPVIRALLEIESVYGPVESTIAMEEPEWTEEEQRELDELIEELKETDAGRKTLRQWMKRNKKFLEAKRKAEKRNAYLAELGLTQQNDQPQDETPLPTAQPPGEVVEVRPLADAEEVKLRKVVQAAPTRKKRELLSLLRELRDGVAFEDSGSDCGGNRDNVSVGGDDPSLSPFHMVR